MGWAMAHAERRHQAVRVSSDSSAQRDCAEDDVMRGYDLGVRAPAQPGDAKRVQREAVAVSAAGLHRDGSGRGGESGATSGGELASTGGRKGFIIPSFGSKAVIVIVMLRTERGKKHEIRRPSVWPLGPAGPPIVVAGSLSKRRRRKSLVTLRCSG
jgi:hypothetical protein